MRARNDNSHWRAILGSASETLFRDKGTLSVRRTPILALRVADPPSLNWFRIIPPLHIGRVYRCLSQGGDTDTAQADQIRANEKRLCKQKQPQLRPIASPAWIAWECSRCLLWGHHRLHTSHHRSLARFSPMACPPCSNFLQTWRRICFQTPACC